MASIASRAHRAFVTVLALTGTTEWAARRLGTARFLPALFIDRFAHTGGLDPAAFGAQMAQCRSFTDSRWTAHWESFAGEYLAIADGALAGLGGPSTQDLLGSPTEADIRKLGELLAPAVEILADRGPVAPPDAVHSFCARHPESRDAAVALDALIKAMVYKYAAAWPGWTPRRLRAYEASHQLCEILLVALAPAMGVTFEVVRIPLGDDEEVRGFLLAPKDARGLPTVLLSQGLEGTLAELTLPLLEWRAEGFTYFIMEMPGTFHYRKPLGPNSEEVYTTVVDFLATHPCVDASRIGMMGVSFGAYWSTRMAAVEPRLRAAISNGAPADHSFKPSGTTGVPEIIIDTIRNTLGANSLQDTMRKASALSLRDHYPRIKIPLLVINGADDTLVRVEDSIEIATYAPDAQLVLYADDDHCAMHHEDEWFELAMRFFHAHLTDSSTR